jgi:hypothetical protein
MITLVYGRIGLRVGLLGQLAENVEAPEGFVAVLQRDGSYAFVRPELVTFETV